MEAKELWKADGNELLFEMNTNVSKTIHILNDVSTDAYPCMLPDA
jgi:hypothetical protein